MSGALASWLVAASALLAMVLAPAPAGASGPTVTGAGSTWAQLALDRWRADSETLGFHINYAGVGSSAGRQYYLLNEVDFAASEIPFRADEVEKLQELHKTWQ